MGGPVDRGSEEGRWGWDVDVDVESKSKSNSRGTRKGRRKAGM